MPDLSSQHTVSRFAGRRRANGAALDVRQLHFLSTVDGAGIPSMAHDS